MDQQTATNIITLVTGLAIGLIAGGGSVLALVSRVKSDTALLAAIEGLANSASPQVIEALRKIVPGLRDAADVIDEATDGVPVKDKPVG